VPAPRLGRVLLRQHAVRPEVVDEAVREQRGSGRRLGEQLVAMGALTPEHLLRALAAQAGTGYLVQIDPARVVEGPGGLSRDTVRALGLVPFEQSRDGERIAVACVAPLPRVSLLALREITGARVDAFLVTDTEWARLAEAYGTRPRADAMVPATTLRSIADAARRVAAAASTGAADRVQRARCEPFVWVRLEGRGRQEDLIVPRGAAFSEEDSWQAAPTPL
jgi:hypothetical protein